MIRLKTNANKILKKLIHSDGVRAYYFSVCERYANGYIQTFITDMQNLITKLGIIIAKVDVNEINISYCARSITYLCTTVLDNPLLIKTFESLGLNDKGNFGKHDIITNKIDLDRAVTTYNNLVISIAKKYNLTSLNAMIVSKKDNNKKEIKSPSKVENQAVKIKKEDKKNVNVKSKIVSKVTKTQQQQNKPNEIATTSDERLKLTAELSSGDGRYVKGLIHKTSMINFRLKVTIDNPDELKIASVTAYFKCGRNTEEMKISRENKSVTSVDLDTARFSGNIEATIIVVYKLALIKSKKIKTTVSKNF